MKKSLFIVAMILVIIGSMLAGTMAQYVKTSAPVTVNPQFKQFNFASVRSDGTSVGLKIAPGETKSWSFIVTNTDADVVSETDMLVSIELSNFDNLPAGMSFLVNNVPYVAGTNVAALAGGYQNSATVILSAVWNTNYNVNEIDYAGKQNATLVVNFTAKQELNFIEIRNSAELLAALRGQADGQTWAIYAGDYGLKQNDIPVANYPDQFFYAAITANNLTIIGIGAPTIFGDQYIPNANWSIQNLITVIGNNVKFDGINFMPKISANKTIEVLGKDFAITNCKFTPNTKTSNTGSDVITRDGGSLYFSGDKGTVLVSGNSFSFCPVVFDSMTVASSVVIEKNVFENFKEADSSYAIGNTSWSTPDTLTMADVLVSNNNFIGDPTDPIIKNRMTGKFILTANTINSGDPGSANWAAYLRLIDDYFPRNNLMARTFTIPQVIVDGTSYFH